MVHVCVHGARGYLGRVLVGLLSQHPEVQEITPVSSSAAGQRYGKAVPSMASLGDLVLASPTDPAVAEADAVLLATDDATAAALVPTLSADQLVIDLSRAHRAQALSGQDGWIYGLPERAPGTPGGAKRIANPGCYPTASLLSLGPAADGGLLADGPVIVDGKSGVSGAGATPRPDLHFPETNESVRAYKVLGHDHTAEIQGGLHGGHLVRFTPHLVPQNRGLLTTSYAPAQPGVEADELQARYEKAYAGSPFVHVVDEPATGALKGSNLCHVAVSRDPSTGLIVARGAIDNLVKGGAGQAVQNLNLALGLPETTGLPILGVAP